MLGTVADCVRGPDGKPSSLTPRYLIDVSEHHVNHTDICLQLEQRHDMEPFPSVELPQANLRLDWKMFKNRD
jgi:hypothetical protein